MKKYFFCYGVTFTLTTLFLLFHQIGHAVAKFHIPVLNNHQKSQLIISNNILLARLPRSRWLTKLPKRSFNRWIDEKKGIYLTKRGSIIGSYEALHSLTQKQRQSLLGINREIEAHHLIEKRVAQAFGFDEKDIPAVLIDKSKHRGKEGIHNIINIKLPRGNRRTGSISYKGKLAQIQQAYQNAYKDHDDWLDAITAIMSEWHSRI